MHQQLRRAVRLFKKHRYETEQSNKRSKDSLNEIVTELACAKIQLKHCLYDLDRLIERAKSENET